VYFDFTGSNIINGAPRGEYLVRRGLVINANVTMNVTPTAVSVSGAVLWNGVTIPNAFIGSDWRLVFRDASGARYTIDFDGGSNTYSGSMYPGTWDVYFDFETHAAINNAPIGEYPIRTGLVLNGNTTLNVTPTAVTISGPVLWNGMTIPNAFVGADWRLVFQAPGGGTRYTVELDGNANAYSALMYPGTWDVYFDFANRAAIPGAPIGEYRVWRALVANGNTTLNVTPTAVVVSGAVLWNGMTIPNALIGPDWRLVFDDHAGGRFTIELDGGANTWAGWIYPGTWDVYFDFEAESVISGAPVGEYRLRQALPVNAATRIDVTPAALPVMGSVLWNGMTIPNARIGTDWQLWYTDPVSGARYDVGFDGGSNMYSMWMYPGTWDVTFDFEALNVIPGAPQGEWTVVNCAHLH
jgi:hypothetical protein